MKARADRPPAPRPAATRAARFAACLWGLAAAALASSAEAREATSLELFGPADPTGWEAFDVVNDDVMGGVSTSRVGVEDGALVFAGTVSLENDGGFASLRAPLGPRDLRGYTGIELEVRGDGRRYKLTLRDAASDTALRVLYRAPFATRARERTTLRVPFTALEAGFRGRPLPDAPPLDRRRIVELGVLIADRQAGDFRLELYAIRAYGGLR